MAGALLLPALVWALPFAPAVLVGLVGLLVMMDRQLAEIVVHFHTHSSEESRIEDLNRLKSLVKHHNVSEVGVITILGAIDVAFSSATKVIEGALTLLAYTIKRLVVQDWPLDFPELSQIVRSAPKHLDVEAALVRRHVDPAIVEKLVRPIGPISPSTIPNRASRSSSQSSIESSTPPTLVRAKTAPQTLTVSKEALATVFTASTQQKAVSDPRSIPQPKEKAASLSKATAAQKLTAKPTQQSNEYQSTSGFKERTMTSNKPPASRAPSRQRIGSISSDGSDDKATNLPHIGENKSGKHNATRPKSNSVSSSGSETKVKKLPPPSKGRPTLKSSASMMNLSHASEANLAVSVSKTDTEAIEPIMVQPDGFLRIPKNLTSDSRDQSAKLDEQCRDMLPAFEGRESEQNWLRREKNVLILRKITKGNAPKSFTLTYLAQIKGLLDGLMKTVNSLRTTVSANGCLLIQEVAIAVGSGLDPMVEILLQNFTKLCGHTKTINAQNGNKTVLIIISHVTYHSRLMQHIWNACQEKNVRPRGFATGWLKTILVGHGHHRNVLEHSNGLELIEKCVRRGLDDSDPGVRESARDIFWTFHSLWPARGDNMFLALKATSQGQLLQHPSNPDPDRVIATPSSVGPTRSNTQPQGRTITTKPSLKDVMLAKKREKAQADRPTSAMATKAPAPPPVLKSSASFTTGSLSSAPLRPARKAVKRTTARENMERPSTPARSIPRPATSASFDRPTAAKKSSERPSRAVKGPDRPSTADESMLRLKASVESLQMSHLLYANMERAETPVRSPQRPIVVAEDPTPEVPKSPMKENMEVHGGTPNGKRPQTPLKMEDEDVACTLATTMSPRVATVTKPGTPLSEELFSPIKMAAGPLAELTDNQINNSARMNPTTSKLIDSGIAHIKAGRLDAHGYRKLHSAVAQEAHTLSAEKYEELLSAIVDAPSTNDRITGQRMNIISALAGTLLIQKHMPRVLLALVGSLREHEGESHMHAVIEAKIVELASATMDAAGCIAALDEGGKGSVAALRAVAALLPRCPVVDAAVAHRVAAMAVAAVNDKDKVEERKAGYELAVELGAAVGGGVGHLLALVNDLAQEDKSLLVYYAMRDGRAGLAG